MEALRTCNTCGVEALDLTWLSYLFYYKKRNYNPRYIETNYENKCKQCKHLYSLNRKDIQRNQDLIRNYGITYNDYKDMYAEQNGECAICKSHYTLEGYKSEKLHVDHCHSTGKVRGLLCHKCNTALGLLKDNTQNLLNAIDYIKQ